MSRASPQTRQYWDSSVFIRLLLNEPERSQDVDVIRQLIHQARGGGLLIVLSDFVLAEVHPPRPGVEPEYQEIVDELFEPDRRYVMWRAAGRSVALRARQIGAAFEEITNPDAIHLATALEAGVDSFLTYDGESKKNNRSGKLLDYDGKVDGLKIERPRIYWGPLFDAPEEGRARRS